MHDLNGEVRAAERVDIVEDVFRRIPWKIAALGTALLLCLGGAFWAFTAIRGASNRFNEATTQVAREGQFEVHTIPLDRAVPAGFESVTSPAQFTDAALFNGKFYLCGPGGLSAFDFNGKPAGQFNVGIDLPPAPLVRMAVGVGGSGIGPQLWIATHGAGLLVFDGRSFQQIQPKVAAVRSLTSVLPLSSGRILLGSEKNGVLVWDGHALALLHPSLANVHVTALAGTEANLWVGTLDQGVLHWQAGQMERISEPEGLPDARVLSLLADGTQAYAGTALGVAEFQNGKLTRKLGPGVFAQSLLLTGDTLSVGTLEEGVIEVPLKAHQPRLRPIANGAGAGSVQRLLMLDGRLAVLAENGLYQKGRPVLETTGARLTDRNISALSVDRAGKLWVGYFDRGLDVLDADLQHFHHFEDEHVFCVNRIAQEPNSGLTAVATANGLAMFQFGKVLEVLTKAQGLIANNVTDVLLRPDGRYLNVTVATPAGLTMLEASGSSSLYAFHGLVNNHVYALAAMHTKLAVGTLGGLSLLDAGVVKANYTTANSGLKQNWITAIQPVGDEWFIGTYGAGVVKLDAAGRWTPFPDLRGQLEINPNAMVATERAVYAGTLGQGLAVFSRKLQRWNFITAGLPSENVTALTVADGYLYIGTGNGLVRVPEQRVSIE